MKPKSPKLLLLLWAVVLCAGVRGQSPPRAEASEAEERPVVYGLVVDNSGLVRPDINHVINAAKQVIDGNGTHDEAFVVRFISSDKIKITQDLTRDEALLTRALDDMHIEDGETAITDALCLSAEHLTKQRPLADAAGRRALILITDGDDRRSRYKAQQLLPLLRENRVSVFVLGLPQSVRSARGQTAYKKAVEYMNMLARETGGQAYLVEKSSELSLRAFELTKNMRGN